MALDPQIALGVTTPAPYNPVPTINAIEGVQSIRALAEQRAAIAQQRNAEAQQLIQNQADQASMNSAVQKQVTAGASDPYEAAATDLEQQGKANVAAKLRTVHTADQKAVSDAMTAQNTAMEGKLKLGGTIVDGMEQNPTLPTYTAGRNAVIAMDPDPVHQKFVASQLPDPSQPGFDPAQIPDIISKFRASVQPQAEYLKAMQDLQAQWDKPGRLGALANALALSPDQTVTSPGGQTVLGKADLIKAAQHQGLDATNANAALALVNAKATPDQIRQQLGMSPEQQQAAEATKAREAQTASNEASRLTIERGQLSVAQAREAREASAATAGLTGTGPLGLPAAEPAGTRHPEALAQLPQGQAQIAAEIGDYKFPLPSGMALRTPYFQNLIEMASKYNPNLDMSQYQVRQKARTSFTTGSDSQNLAALNTAVEHLGNLSQDVQSLGNFGGMARPLNAPVNALERTFDVGKAATATGAYNTDANAVADEMKKVFGGTGGSEADAMRWRSGLSADDAPDQQMTNIRAGVGLLGSRLDVLQKKYEQAMGEPLNFAMLNPKAAAILQKIAPGVIDTSKFSAPASGGGASSALTHQPVPGHPGVFASSPDGGKTWKVDGGV